MSPKYAWTLSLMMAPGGPTCRHEDAKKLSRVRRALRAGNIETAKRDAEVFELTPVA